MLMPSRMKFRKKQRGHHRGKAKRGSNISFGDYALVAVDRGNLTSQQIEAARVAITRHVKRGGKLWMRVFPDIPYTKKPAETRMGKGKGSPEFWYVKVKPGRVLFELSGVPEDLAKEAMTLARHKLPFKTKFHIRPTL